MKLLDSFKTRLRQWTTRSPHAPGGAGLPDRLELRTDSCSANIAGIRKAVECFCLKGGLDEAATGEVGLCVNEALANIIRHAYHGAAGRPIFLWAESLEWGVRINIRDWGDGVMPVQRPRPCHESLIPGGLGLVCLRQLMDEVQYTPQSDGMLLTMSRKRDRSLGGKECPGV